MLATILITWSIIGFVMLANFLVRYSDAIVWNAGGRDWVFIIFSGPLAWIGMLLFVAMFHIDARMRRTT